MWVLLFVLTGLAVNIMMLESSTREIYLDLKGRRSSHDSAAVSRRGVEWDKVVGKGGVTEEALTISCFAQYRAFLDLVLW